MRACLCAPLRNPVRFMPALLVQFLSNEGQPNKSNKGRQGGPCLNKGSIHQFCEASGNFCFPTARGTNHEDVLGYNLLLHNPTPRSIFCKITAHNAHSSSEPHALLGSAGLQYIALEPQFSSTWQYILTLQYIDIFVLVQVFSKPPNLQSSAGPLRFTAR